MQRNIIGIVKEVVEFCRHIWKWARHVVRLLNNRWTRKPNRMAMEKWNFVKRQTAH